MDSTALITASVARILLVRLCLPVGFLICACPLTGAEAPDFLRGSQQYIVVTTPSWSAQAGRLAMFEQKGDKIWRQRESPIPVVVGKAGLAWGRGLMHTPAPPGPIKVEGDNRAPAGIFRLRFVFGYAPPRKVRIRMPYLGLSENIVAIDDPRSRYYNQLVDRTKIKDSEWGAEQMMLRDGRYKWGVFVEHNFPAKPGAGSCIFLHVWKNSETATAGCTALAENDLVNIIRWLDPARRPLLVQMPQPIYKQMREEWNLPDLW
jgi:D-alanyl-D-alanine dipeptidase